MRFYDVSDTSGLPEDSDDSVLSTDVFSLAVPMDKGPVMKEDCAFIRIQKATLVKPPEGEEEEPTSVIVTKVHMADDTATAWSELASAEFDYHAAFVLEGVKNAPAPAAEAAPAEEAAEGEEGGEAPPPVANPPAKAKAFRELWAFETGEEGATTFSSVRCLNLLASGEERVWGEPQAVEGDTPAPRKGMSLLPFRDNQHKAYLFGGCDASEHGNADGSEDTVFGYYNDTWVFDTEVRDADPIETSMESTNHHSEPHSEP